MERLKEEELTLDGELFSRSELLEQLERVLESRHFRNSRRYPSLLRYVVEHTLTGDVDSLKERTLGVEVFARAGDYDTNADPVVRITAGEVRKRLAQYYQDGGHQSEVRIDMPPGAYVPHFFRSVTGREAREEESAAASSSRPKHEATPPTGLPAVSQPGTPAPEEPEPATPVVQPVAARSAARKGWLGWILAVAAVLLAVLGTCFVIQQRRSERALLSVWQPVVSSSDRCTILVGVHSLDEAGHEKLTDPNGPQTGVQHRVDMLDAMVRSDMVPVSDLVSYSHLTDLIVRHGRSYQTHGSEDASIEEIRKGPVVLVGGLDNVWTLRLTSKLRFRFEQKLQTANGIVDSEHPERVWRFNNMQDAASTTQDFALVASYFDTTIDQPVVVVAGIGKSGTEIAAEFVTSEASLQQWLREAHAPAGKRNSEVVLMTEVVDGKAGPPKVVASAFW